MERLRRLRSTHPAIDLLLLAVAIVLAIALAVLIAAAITALTGTPGHHGD